MPGYFTSEEINSMIAESNELIFNLGNTIANIRAYLSQINMYTILQSKESPNTLKYYYWQGHILRLTSTMENIIYPNHGFTYISSINNKPVSYEEECFMIDEKIDEIQQEKKHIKKLEKSKKFHKHLVLGSMNKLLPDELLENVAYYLTDKRPSKKKQSTTWQNFCKQRKLAGLNYKDNSSIWRSLDSTIKNKYKNPYYAHF